MVHKSMAPTSAHPSEKRKFHYIPRNNRITSQLRSPACKALNSCVLEIFHRALTEEVVSAEEIGNIGQTHPGGFSGASFATVRRRPRSKEQGEPEDRQYHEPGQEVAAVLEPSYVKSDIFGACHYK
jgi:hypothetical protein